MVPGPAWFLSATAFAISMSATPGPNNAMLSSSGLTWGFRRTLPHMLGISLGFPVMVSLVGVGGGDLLRTHPTALDALRWVGGAYLLWLAWKVATATPTPELEDSRGSRGRPFAFWQAALFQWVNPKAWIIVVSALTTLGSAGGRPLTGRALLIAVIFLAVNLPVAAMWTMIGVGVGRVLRTTRALRRFNVSMAVLLVVSLIAALAGG